MTLDTAAAAAAEPAGRTRRPEVRGGEGRLASAWALKEACYAAWSSEPQRAARAADALCALHLGKAGRGEPSAHAREIEALADWTAGIAHVTGGRMDAALWCFDRAAEIFRALGQADHAAQTQVPKIMALSMLGRYDAAVECAGQAQRAFVALGDVRAAGKVSLNLGALHGQRGDYPQAARDSRAAAVLFARIGDHEHSVMADINMADALTSMGDFDEALRICARARMRAGTHGFPVLEALVDESVALLQLARGDYRKALAGFDASRRRYEELGMPQHLAIAERQLADAYLELRLLPEALALFDQALVRFETLNIPDEQAWTLAQLGRAQALLARPAAAAQAFERAAALFAAQGCGVGEAAVALARAELALTRGDAGTAAQLAGEAGEGFRAAGQADGGLRADVVRAHALLQAGKDTAAQALFDATLDRARDLGLLTVQVRCLTGQGLVRQAQGDAGAARTALEAAIELFEHQRRALPDDELRSAFLTDHQRPYHELLRMALSRHARTPSPERAAAVLFQLDRLRASSLGERLAESGSPDNALGTQGLRDRLNWLYRRTRRLDEAGESSAALAGELRRTEFALLERARRDRLAAPAPASASAPVRADRPDAGETIAALQAAFGADDALVEYGVVDNELFACVLTRSGVVVQRRVAAWDAVLEALRAARFQLDTLRHGAAPVQRHMAMLASRTQSHMRRLHALVWAPLAPALAGCRRVLVVPHAQLGALAFAALHDGERFLGQHCELAVVASARLALRGLLRPPGRARQVLALGETRRLPHAAQEASFVAGLFPDGRAFVGEAATLATLGAHVAHADVLHLACHAQFRGDNPRFSALHLHDGPLTVESVEGLRMRPAIVVLSGCETGVADLGSGDEMVGLVRAFMVAGAARVVASLWPVDDAIAAVFMARFYAALGHGDAPATALRQAQTDVMREHPHPFFWAAFTLHGGW